ncbi:MAG: glycoside hydrolase family 9 protein [candidate division KSB1 bacterium]|nr:glycoside hydrolase family 9 protein [candidate division KSB1 bacterium]
MSLNATPIAKGRELTVAPENELQRMKIKSLSGPLQLLDGRIKHNNGWFVVRSEIPAGATTGAIEWIVTPNIVDSWHYGPVVHTSQVGYHPNQEKRAVIELDKRLAADQSAVIKRIDPDNGYTQIATIEPQPFKGEFLRFNYLIADFSEVKEPGMYVVQYGDVISEAFQIDATVYDQGVWQPVLEYFLPVQMCHMKVFEKYRVWHDVCHLDDALMAPPNINHFDGYTHGELPEGYKAYQPVEGLNAGGWHDAGDYDMRIESQVGTVFNLALAVEEFAIDYDQTLVDVDRRIVEIHHPDGKPDALQQIEHGLAAILGGYRAFNELYRGIICNNLRQYVLLGDAGSMTDNKVFEGPAPKNHNGLWFLKVSTDYSKYYNPQDNYDMIEEHVPELDDRMVFMNEGPGRQLDGITGLAAASRVLRGYNDKLADEALETAENLWDAFGDSEGRWVNYAKISSLVELIITTNKEKYKQAFIELKPEIKQSISRMGWNVARALPFIKDTAFKQEIEKSLEEASSEINAQARENPFGVPYHPAIWGAGWGIQEFGVSYYFLNKHHPDLFPIDPMLNALNFVLGCHPGENTASFASNIGTRSQTVAYGVNRADWSFIPGGVVSGTNLTRPDFPEMKDWPFMWQQTEYVVGGGSTHFMFLVLGAQKYLSK